MTRFIFVTGGVLSSLGKGIAASSIGTLLQARGFKVHIRKMDPYINFDPGTLSPYQHGEVFVTEDGCETDLDLGHYERFTNINTTKNDNITAGRIYQEVITRERRGDYKGQTVQVIPHITNHIKEFIKRDTDTVDFLIYEIGGTVGDIESLPFIEAIRQLGNEMKSRPYDEEFKSSGYPSCLYIHLTLVPYIASAAELKTKPTQHSVKELRGHGIQPDILICRSERIIPLAEREKLSLFCNIPSNRVISAVDVPSIYQVPLSFHQEGLDTEICKHFGLPYKSSEDALAPWAHFITQLQNPKKTCTIAIVGKYIHLKDAYKSLTEAFVHSGVATQIQPVLKWLDAEIVSFDEIEHTLKDVDGILVPGGFGMRGTEGKIQTIRYARENKIPFFGICLGMQLALIETARSLANLPHANSSEFQDTDTPIIGLMSEWNKEGLIEKRHGQENLGGTLRLGNYPCQIKPGSLLSKIYNTDLIQERHRHRYEVNKLYKENLEKAGTIFSGLSPDNKLVEAIERTDHPWFVAVQFHPELKSRPFTPHPLFVSFLQACLQKVSS